MTIIIGYDGSEGARGAIEFAGQYFSGRDAIVVTAFEDWPPAVHGGTVQIGDATRGRERKEDPAEEKTASGARAMS